jgi:hypothetical protein
MQTLAQTGLVRAIAASLAAASVATLSHASVDINGGTSWGGWNSVGTAQTSGIWLRGATNRTFNIYQTAFTLDAGQTVGGSRLADGAAGDGSGYTGDSAGSLFSGSWQAGDRILGFGIQYTGATRGTTWFFHKDSGGNNMFAASSFGALDGQTSFDVGDTSSYIPNSAVGMDPADRGRVRQYSVWNGFSQFGSPEEGNFDTPFGTVASLAMPVRSFSVLDAGSTTLSTSLQYFINIDAVLRSNGGSTFGDGDFGPNTKFGFFEGDLSGASGQFTQQIFSIPAPGALALLGLAGLAGSRRRR